MPFFEPLQPFWKHSRWLIPETRKNAPINPFLALKTILALVSKSQKQKDGLQEKICNSNGNG